VGPICHSQKYVWDPLTCGPHISCSLIFLLPLLVAPFSLFPLTLSLSRGGRRGLETTVSGGDDGRRDGDAEMAAARFPSAAPAPDKLNVWHPRWSGRTTQLCSRRQMDGWGHGGSRRRAAQLGGGAVRLNVIVDDRIDVEGGRHRGCHGGNKELTP
jgi:hypothetical protein